MALVPHVISKWVSWILEAKICLYSMNDKCQIQFSKEGLSEEAALNCSQACPERSMDVEARAWRDSDSSLTMGI